MPRAAVMAPAVKLAEEGFILNQGDADILAMSTKHFVDQPNVAAIFLNEGEPWQAGEVLVQKNLATTLKLIAEQGPDAFYKGSSPMRL